MEDQKRLIKLPWLISWGFFNTGLREYKVEAV
jgi:hypothetical protein